MKNLPTRILLAEDVPTSEEVLIRQLTKAKLHNQVKVFNDGARALDYLNDKKSGAEELVAVFLDITLPTIDGLGVLKAIRANEVTRHLPVILMTASVETEMVEDSRKLGASFVKKPLTFSAFAKAVTDTFHNRRDSISATRTMPENG